MEEKYWILLNKHAANDLTPTEREELQRWTDDDPERKDLLIDFREIRNVVSEDENAPVVDTDAAWLKMQYKIAQDEQPAPIVEKLAFKQFLVRAAVVAAITAAAITGYLIFK